MSLNSDNSQHEKYHLHHKFERNIKYSLWNHSSDEKCIFELSWVHIQQLCDALQYFIYLENVLLSFHQVPLQYISSRNGNLYCRMYSHDINESDERNGTSIFHPWMRVTDKTTRKFFLNVLNNFFPWIWKKFCQFCFSPWNKSPHQLTYALF